MRGGTLVVCPLVALIQWQAEIAKFTQPGALKVGKGGEELTRYITYIHTHACPPLPPRWIGSTESYLSELLHTESPRNWPALI